MSKYKNEKELLNKVDIFFELLVNNTKAFPSDHKVRVVPWKIFVEDVLTMGIAGLKTSLGLLHSENTLKIIKKEWALEMNAWYDALVKYKKEQQFNSMTREQLLNDHSR